MGALLRSALRKMEVTSYDEMLRSANYFDLHDIVEDMVRFVQTILICYTDPFVLIIDTKNSKAI